MVDIDLGPSTVDEIFKSYEESEKKESRRPHLGASIIGKECSREIWYSFRWATKVEFEGRMLRLFKRGHREEPELIDDLERIGCSVYVKDENGNRYRKHQHGGHYSGEFDAIVIGLPESPKKPHVVDFKTSNQKGFNALSKYGLEKKKPVHLAQLQVLMDMFDVDDAAYLVACKNDDNLYFERVTRKKKEGKRLRDKALRIIESPTPPEKVSDDPTSFGCRFCDAKEICHGMQVADVNCRTCIHSTPVTDGDGGWECVKELEPSSPETGCPEHIFIPDLIPFAGAVDAAEDGTHIVYEDAEGNQFVNVASAGFPAMDIPHHSSKELRAMEPKAAFSAGVAAVKKILGGEVAG